MAAAEAAVAYLAAEGGRDAVGGLILLDREGCPGWAWNTAAMPHAWIRDGERGEGM
jgi:isoaspartyl peptidase/L-asparaginase-like protein (Ntn-hydrolase superfamily)